MEEVSIADPRVGFSPAEHVFIVLAESLRQGDEFTTAWARATKSLPRPTDEEWLDALHFSRPHFRQEYEERAALLRARRAMAA